MLLNRSMNSPRATYVLVEGAHSQLVQWVEVLKWPRGESHNKIQMLHAPGHNIEVVAYWYGGSLVYTLVYGVL